MNKAKPQRSLVERADAALANPARNLMLGLVYMALVMTSSTLAYVLLAGWSLSDAVYMVIITVFTVGYDEVHPIVGPLLRAITIGNVVFGCTGVIFMTGALVQFITLNQINEMIGVRRMANDIGRLTNHVVICGFGRIGTMLAAGLRAGGAAFVILERDEAKCQEARELGFLCLHADATDEQALQSAGIQRARVLATVVPDDAANVFITLSARSLAPEIEIIARGEVPATERKLLQAGATRVILPQHIGAERIVEMILYKGTATLLQNSERMTAFDRDLRGLGLNLDLVTAAPGSPAVGMSLRALERAAAGAFFIVQVNRAGNAFNRPTPEMLVEAGDGLMLIGRVLGDLGLFEPGGRPGVRRSAR